MSSFQPCTDKSTELNPFTSGDVGEAASNLANAAGQLASDKLSPRLEGASRALRGDSSTSAGVTTAQKTPLEIAQEMVDSYEFNQSTGVSTFTVPAGVTDVDAMKALNEYFRKNHSTFNRDAVCAEDLDWYQNLPLQHPQYCQERDYSQPRQITITGVVDDTTYQSRTSQRCILEVKSLVFSDPRDQALAAALHACKNDGVDLFNRFYVRGSVPGFALLTHHNLGVFFAGSIGSNCDSDVAASGSPSPE